MQLHDLKPAPGSTKRRKVVGRGPGSGHGKNSTRGHKGHKKHGQVNANFEGGQTPLHRRLPQLRGFRAVNKKIYAVVNVEALEAFDYESIVDPDMLIAAGVLRDIRVGVMILSDGDLIMQVRDNTHKYCRNEIET